MFQRYFSRVIGAPTNSVAHAPRIISMTMTSRCNLRCVMCDHGIRNVEKEDFDPELIDRIGDFISRADVVDLTGLGEPTLSKLFWKIVDQFPEASAQPGTDPFLMFNTNAVALTPAQIDRLLLSRVRRIRVSIDSPDSETFQQIRKTDLANVVANVKKLVEAKKKTGRRYPIIGIEMTVMRRNVHQMRDMIDLVKEIGADFVEFWSINEIGPDSTKDWIITTGTASFSYKDELLSDFDQVQLSGLIDEATEHATATGVPAAFIMLGKGSSTANYPSETFKAPEIAWKENSIRCDLPWKELRADYSGKVTACCWGPRPIGNLRTSTMEEVWNAPVIREMRTDLLNGNVPAACVGAACQVLAGHREKALLAV